jgi:hypothetical protein
MPFTPVTINPLQAWVQSVIPTVYDDSLSYLEFLGKVMAKLNELIASDAAQSAALQEFLNTFEGDLTATVSAYLDTWKKDGTIQAILTASLGEFNVALVAHKTEVEGKLVALETDLENQINAVAADVLQKQTLIYVNVKDFGATGDGITNDQTAIQAANDASSGKTLFFPAGLYLANQLTMTCNWVMADGAKIRYAGVDGNILVTCSGNYLIGKLDLDGDNNAPYALLSVTGDYNIFTNLSAANLNANDGLGLNNVKSGVILRGAHNIIHHLQLSSFVNGGHINGSMPQGLLLDGPLCDNNRVIHLTARNIHSGIIPNNAGKTSFVDSAIFFNSQDTGIYALNGLLYVGQYTFSGNDEAMVIQDQVVIEQANILKAPGGVVVLGANKADAKIEIGHLMVGEGVVGAGSTLIKTRTTNVLFDKVYIGKLEGTLKTGTLAYIYDGVVNYMTINNVDLRFLYDAAITTPLSSWFYYDAVKGFSFKNWKIKIVDVNNALTSSNEFYLVRNTDPLRHSWFENVDILITNNDETTVSAAFVRMTNLAKALITTQGVRWQHNIGPYGRQATYGEPGTTTGIPVGGTWRAGQVLYQKNPAAAGFIGLVCVTAGTPGTWKTFGAISA